MCTAGHFTIADLLLERRNKATARRLVVGRDVLPVFSSSIKVSSRHYFDPWRGRMCREEVALYRGSDRLRAAPDGDWNGRCEVIRKMDLRANDERILLSTG